VLRLVAIVGPTATGKSALAISIAKTFDGEVVACDSTAVYRRVDIGTDKVPVDEQQGITHHMVDRAGPAEVYSAAQYAADASEVIRDIARRGRLPVLAGGTGFYFRALVRGLCPGPSRDVALRQRLERVASRRGVEWLHRALARVDPASARRIQPRDRARIVRALEVYTLTGRPLTSHFEQTRSPLSDFTIQGIGLRLPRPILLGRVAKRVDAQFDRGVVDEVQALLSSGVSRDAHALNGLVYRQVLELLAGIRDEPATRELIVRENMRYARRQETWFRRESLVEWIDGAGETAAVREIAIQRVRQFLGASAVVPGP
jgi:tRNA dimethylallyltransferase